MYWDVYQSVYTAHYYVEITVKLLIFAHPDSQFSSCLQISTQQVFLALSLPVFTYITIVHYSSNSKLFIILHQQSEIVVPYHHAIRSSTKRFVYLRSNVWAYMCTMVQKIKVTETFNFGYLTKCNCSTICEAWYDENQRCRNR